VKTALKRAALSGLCLLALPASARTDGQAAEARFNIQVIVGDCYTTSVVEVSIDGRPLALISPAQREDSVGICFDGTESLGPQTAVRIRTPSADRRINVSPAVDSRFLFITPGLAPHVVFMRDRPALD
jgi:hypothetical protein